MQLIANQLGFQRLSMDEHKETRISLTPDGQRDIFDSFAILTAAKIEALKVLKHFRQAKELRNKFLHIRGAILAGQAICGVQCMESAIRQVKVIVYHGAEFD